jgi:hypothetical protein
MEAGIRSAPLYFSVIRAEQPPSYSRSSSGKSKAEIRRLRAKFEAGQAQRKARQNHQVAFTPAKDDEEYLNAMFTDEWSAGAYHRKLPLGYHPPLRVPVGEPAARSAIRRHLIC